MGIVIFGSLERERGKSTIILSVSNSPVPQGHAHTEMVLLFFFLIQQNYATLFQLHSVLTEATSLSYSPQAFKSQ